MSNLIAAINETALEWLSAAGMTAFSITIIVITGTFRPRSALGPARAPADAPIAPWALAVFIGALGWLGVQILYGGYMGATRAPATQPSGPLDLQPHDLAILSTLPQFAGAGIIIAIAAGMPGWLRRMGLTIDRLPRAMLLAPVGILAAYPIVFWAGQALEKLYELINYEHPVEHEILKELGAAPSKAVSVALVVGATVAAPLFEELLFRGGLQTLFRWFFTRLRNGTETPATAWGAIAVTSALFAMIHPLWMAPMIFVLSLCFGYVYERTGNLWACILMHAIFNALNLVFYLA